MDAKWEENENNYQKILKFLIAIKIIKLGSYKKRGEVLCSWKGVKLI